MDADTLAAALTFGGSSRFNDRSSLGRYGMGLPNGTLSRSRRVEVYTWRGAEALRSVLDLDRITTEGEAALPSVEAVAPPFPVPAASGTAVRLLACDRVEYRRPSALARKLEEELGRMYRHFLAGGLRLTVNGRRVAAVRPAFPAAGQRNGATDGNSATLSSIARQLRRERGKSRYDSASFPWINGMTFPPPRRRHGG